MRQRSEGPVYPIIPSSNVERALLFLMMRENSQQNNQDFLSTIIAEHGILEGLRELLLRNTAEEKVNQISENELRIVSIWLITWYIKEYTAIFLTDDAIKNCLKKLHTSLIKSAQVGLKDTEDQLKNNQQEQLLLDISTNITTLLAATAHIFKILEIGKLLISNQAFSEIQHNLTDLSHSKNPVLDDLHDKTENKFCEEYLANPEGMDTLMSYVAFNEKEYLVPLRLFLHDVIAWLSGITAYEKLLKNKVNLEQLTMQDLKDHYEYFDDLAKAFLDIFNITIINSSGKADEPSFLRGISLMQADLTKYEIYFDPASIEESTRRSSITARQLQAHIILNFPASLQEKIKLEFLKNAIFAKDTPYLLPLQLINLFLQVVFTNTAKAVSEKSSGECHLSIEQNSTGLCIAVRDTGHGFLQPYASKTTVRKGGFEFRTVKITAGSKWKKASGSGTALTLLTEYSQLLGCKVLYGNDVTTGSAVVCLDIPLEQAQTILH